jgi:hypothetical protein
MEGQALVISTIICVLFCNTGDLCSAAHNGSVVNIGILLNQNTRVGKVAKIAMEMEEDDVNRDTQLLNRARLVLHFRDTQGDLIVGASHEDSATIDLGARLLRILHGPDCRFHRNLFVRRMYVDFLWLLAQLAAALYLWCMPKDGTSLSGSTSGKPPLRSGSYVYRCQQ